MACLHPWGLTRLRLRPAGCSCVAVYLPAVGCGYGQEAILLESGERLVPYLFKLRHTAKVRALVQRMMREGARWQALESSLRLSGWSQERRVILVREAPSRAPVAKAELVIGIDPAALAHPPGVKPRKAKKKRRGKDRQSQLPLPSASGAGWDARATPWSGKIAVLVCAKILELSAALSPLRSGCSRPMLMSGVGRQWQSGGQRTIKVSILHERRAQVARAIRQINGEIGQIRPITGAYAPKV